MYSSFCVGAHSIDLVKALDTISEWANMWQLKIATNQCVAVAHRVILPSTQTHDNSMVKRAIYMGKSWSKQTGYTPSKSSQKKHKYQFHHINLHSM